MSASRLPQIVLIVSLIAIAIGLSVLFAPQAAVAQCEDPEPSCCTCHTTAHPVFEQGEWHTIHARKECCRSCHGGNDRAQDEETAHVGIVLNPLTDTYTACHQCHPDDYQQRADRFAVALHITPMSSEPLSQTVAFQPPSNVPPIKLPSATSPVEAADATPWLWALVVIVAALLIGLMIVWRKLARS
jgi:phosphate/sulfate permease